MVQKDVKHIVEKMNECGQKGVPFLFAFDYEMTGGIFIKNPLEQSDIFFELNGVGNKLEEKPVCLNNKIDVFPESFESYEEKFGVIRKGLLRGDSFLANLTVRTSVKTDVFLSDIFLLNKARYQLYIPDRFVCFSPECFVKIRDGKISTHPMKGTIDASVKNAEELLLNDFKETAEHNTIVDLLRNDLSISAKNVRIERFRYIDRIQTSRHEILQVSSEITGELPLDYRSHLGDIIYKMLPAGSICGAPKQATLEMIRQAEKVPRGYYTGVFGYFDGSDLDSGVLIRFIEQEKGELFFRSGGGITANSDCQKEYQEVLDKIYLPF